MCCFQASVFVEPAPGQHINPYDLAVDPYARVVYWSDTARRVIAVTRMADGEIVGIVVSDVSARSIALAPQQGYVGLSSRNYYTNPFNWPLFFSVIYLPYHVSGSTRPGTHSRMLSRIQRQHRLYRACSCITSASSALGVLNCYVLH